MASTVKWLIKFYTLAGAPLTASYANYDTLGGTSNEARHAFNRSLLYNLNGIDQLDFSLRLDDPAALNVKRLKTVVKLFRIVDDPVREVSLLGNNPSFCGIVGAVNKDGDANEVKISAFNPMWRMQFHFHILNHYLELNPDTGENYTQSELMWKIIDLIQGAFGNPSYLGIEKGTFEWGLPDEPQPTPYFIAKGSNSWSNMFDDLMARAASPDIFSDYKHTDNDPTLMEFGTMEKRGLDKSASLKFNYHTNPATLHPNLSNMVESSIAAPGEFGNYLWAVGQGGPNSGKVAVKQNPSAAADSDGYGEIGVYMVKIDREEIKRLSALGPIAEAELHQRKHPQDSYAITVAPNELYYDYDFVLGDVGELNADKGALQVSGAKQRIYQVQLTMSENNLETADILVSNDFYGKQVPDTGGTVESGGTGVVVGGTGGTGGGTGTGGTGSGSTGGGGGTSGGDAPTSYTPNKTFDGGGGSNVDSFLASLEPGDIAGLSGICLSNSHTFMSGGTSGSPIIITSTDFAHPATIKFTGSTRWDIRGSAGWIVWDFLYIDDVQTSQPTTMACGGHDLIFRRLDITNHSTHIGMDFINDGTYGVSTRILMERCNVHDIGPLTYDNRSHGIYNQGVDNTFQDNILQHCSARGIQDRAATRGTYNYNISVNNRVAIIVGDLGGSHGLRGTKNILAFNEYAAIRTYSNSGGSDNILDDNWVYGPTDSVLEHLTATGVHIGDPMFVDRAGRDFNLAGGSPAAGYGPRYKVGPIV